MVVSGAPCRVLVVQPLRGSTRIRPRSTRIRPLRGSTRIRPTYSQSPSVEQAPRRARV